MTSINNISFIKIIEKSTRLQSLIWSILILLLTHFIQLFKQGKMFSKNLFWYRIFEIMFTTIIYGIFLRKESINNEYPDNQD